MPTLTLSKWSTQAGGVLDVDTDEGELLDFLGRLRALPQLSPDSYLDAVNAFARQSGRHFSKAELVHGYRQLVTAGKIEPDRRLEQGLRLKPVRTSSGVAPVTVLTKPYACPGECIFCPTFVSMPKSYVPDEPGSLRALQNEFDPFRQTSSRLHSFRQVGHSTDKVELLILGGTWSAYPRDYQSWFVQRCLDAMNGCDSVSLAEAQRLNENAGQRNVGLVIETRPDAISPREVLHLRRLGVTKVQLGLQSLDDRILALNKRGHTAAEMRQAVRLLRGAGFKIVLHWMANLYGDTLESDYEDFQRLWSDPAIRPDELKIYPNSLLKETELYGYYERGLYLPYEEADLVALIARCKPHVPPYCRINRVFRDIPSPNIVAGNKKTNLRQLVQEHMRQRGMVCRCLRCREVRGQEVAFEQLRLDVLSYDTDINRELFLSFVTPDDKVAGFLRLSLPNSPGVVPIPEIQGAAMIRELHVYGPALGLGSDSAGEAQHLGLGRRLVEHARDLARAAGYPALAVISAIGTRGYYRRLGFEMGELYMVQTLR
ncbi:MAG: tRNA uridine(34) 5-carboxymethylaminomethyl modification radical SAM/GNAT enzyme Elp3 [Caldilineales bacterium]|nr:tRNA uridine(34) 5-carboxymethylaminomethyl modification radical SAM/GNAT enzyme Elp3 [Caldilineales bacterium]MCW5856768.1 tRNA uridine(34) 5-carboxymethylaminomethyl modification radical SAM/GNAT enzyme Elp3 [Caldilineales bacterium]